jgi:LmbE family N-acetylglucosaminyl deacetylase
MIEGDKMISKKACLVANLLLCAVAIGAAQQPQAPQTGNPFREISGKTIMIISPHPDDDIIGAAGALAYLSGHNNKVVTIFLTSGEVGTYDPALKPEKLRAIRMKEAAAAYKALGFSDAEQVWFGYPDDGLDFAPLQEVRQRLVKEIRKRKPDMVFALDPGATFFRYHYHDHRVAAIASVDALNSATLPLKYPELGPAYKVPNIWYFYTGEPTHRVDISDVLDKKVAALGAHRSQFSPAHEHYEEQGPAPARQILEDFIALFTGSAKQELYRHVTEP